MEYVLPPLPYALDALAPHISAETMEYHYHKHHKTYVTKLNELIRGTPLYGLSLEEVVRKSEKALFNNAAQAWNHTFFWNSMKPQGGGQPKGALAEAIARKWSSFDKFKEDFAASATGNFGSGWTWLVRRSGGALDIVNTSNAQTPLTGNDKPLLTLDVWEHAYYIDYRNQRPKFVTTFLDALVNWDFAEANFKA